MSGGMSQRVMIAMAISCDPKLLIADEPTTALDVTIQAQILELIKDLQAEMGMTVLLITHDLGVIAETCDDVVVMYAGKVAEKGTVFDLFDRPKHPYTQGLLASIPTLETVPKSKLSIIEGMVPGLLDLPEGCRFQNRCPHQKV
jgi:peptide/nickel transport system ATP-binding protein